MSRECPACATEITPIDGLCPICGYEFPHKSQLGIRLVAVILILLFIYPLIELVRFILGH